MADKFLADRAAEHLRREIGPQGLERYNMIEDVVNKHWKDYYERYNSDISKWPYGEYERLQRETEGLVNSLTPPHLKKAFEQLDDLSVIDPNWPDAEEAARKVDPELIARMERNQVQPVQEPATPRMERGQVKPAQEPRAPVSKPTTTSRTTTVSPPVKLLTQKPAQVTPVAQPYGKYAETIKGFENLASKGAYKPASSDWREKMVKDLEEMERQSENQKIAQQRLGAMMKQQEPAPRAKDLMPVSLPEDVNRTGE